MIRKAVVTAMVLGVLGTSLVVGGQASAAPGCAVPGQIKQDGRWEHIRVPEFPIGPQTMSEYNVDPADPNRLLVTNGLAVLLSVDGGCLWDTTFRLDDPPAGADYSASDATIVDVATAPGHVLLAISQRDGLRPHVVLSSYGGETWRQGDDGLETSVGSPIQAGFTRAEPRYAYVLLEQRIGSDGGASLGYRVMESTTAGGAWSTRGDPQGPAPAVELPGGQRIGDGEVLTGMVPDPEEGGRVFLYGQAGLYAYQQGVQMQLLPGDIGALAAAHPEGSRATTLLASSHEGRTVNISYDSGTTFSSFQAPGRVDSFAEGLLPGDFFFSSTGKVWLRSGGKLTDISPPSGAAIQELSAAHSRQQITPFRAYDIVTLYGRSGDSIVRTAERRIIDTPAAPDSVVIGNLPPLKPKRKLPGVLTPSDTEVVLMEGRQTTVPYELNLPETPTPLDVFFDVDTTNSMLPAIDGLRAAMADIIRELAAVGINVWFGAGQYKSYDTPPAFERMQDIAPPGPGLSQALNRMRSSGGGNETQLESLYEIATGEGSTYGAGIEPGQQAHWRRGSLRVVVNMTDEPISTGGPHPTYEKATGALLDDDIKHFGIAVQNEATVRALGAPLPGLIKISRLARSLAPSQGVDCNGDDRPDLYAGEPLVCVVDHVNSRDASVLGGAIISVLRSVTDVGEVRISARFAERSSYSIDEIATPRVSLFSRVNFKARNRIGFDVSFGCPDVRRLELLPVTIEATRKAGVLASATATVVCKPAPEPATAPRPPAAPMVVAAVPLVPPPNPPQQPNPNPHPNPNPNPAQQTQGQGQGAVAAQEEERPQLALSYERDIRINTSQARRDRSREKYAMSRYAAAEGSPDALFLAAAAALVMGFCTALAFGKSPSVSACLARQGSGPTTHRR
jgi:hypothetical protein